MRYEGAWERDEAGVGENGGRGGAVRGDVGWGVAGVGLRVTEGTVRHEEVWSGGEAGVGKLEGGGAGGTRDCGMGGEAGVGAMGGGCGV